MNGYAKYKRGKKIRSADKLYEYMKHEGLVIFFKGLRGIDPEVVIDVGQFTFFDMMEKIKKGEVYEALEIES